MSTLPVTFSIQGETIEAEVPTAIALDTWAKLLTYARRPPVASSRVEPEPGSGSVSIADIEVFYSRLTSSGKEFIRGLVQHPSDSPTAIEIAEVLGYVEDEIEAFTRGVGRRRAGVSSVGADVFDRQIIRNQGRPGASRYELEPDIRRALRNFLEQERENP